MTKVKDGFHYATVSEALCVTIAPGPAATPRQGCGGVSQREMQAGGGNRCTSDLLFAQR
jgi:hypothetical protein